MTYQNLVAIFKVHPPTVKCIMTALTAVALITSGQDNLMLMASNFHLMVILMNCL